MIVVTFLGMDGDSAPAVYRGPLCGEMVVALAEKHNCYPSVPAIRIAESGAYCVTYSNDADDVPNEVDGGWEFDCVDHSLGDMSLLIEDVKVLKRPFDDCRPAGHLLCGDGVRVVFHPSVLEKGG